MPTPFIWSLSPSALLLPRLGRAGGELLPDVRDQVHHLVVLEPRPPEPRGGRSFYRARCAPGKPDCFQAIIPPALATAPPAPAAPAPARRPPPRPPTAGFRGGVWRAGAGGGAAPPVPPPA